jgi:hypothetical protein
LYSVRASWIPVAHLAGGPARQPRHGLSVIGGLSAFIASAGLILSLPFWLQASLATRPAKWAR